MSDKQRLVRITLLAYRNPKLSEDEFHYHWTNVHAPLASAHLAKFGIIQYKQYHTPSSIRSTFIDAVPSLKKDTSSLVDYDGFVELLMPDLSCYERAIKDKYYTDVIAPDEAYFADMERTKAIVGWEEMHIQDGQAVTTGSTKS